MLHLLDRVPEFTNLKSEISDLRSKAEGISRQLRACADSLQNSDIRGTRYLTDKSRRVETQRKEREEFLKELAEIRNRKTP
jgi:septal ring factor EnvC (AmiA/AmiB activator)